MSSWGNNDNAANAPYWAVNSAVTSRINVGQSPTLANVTLFYGNTSPNVYMTNTTTGLFLVDMAEEQVQRSGNVHPAHSGWSVKRAFQGGRAGRVQWETLVTLSGTPSDNNSDDTTLADAVIRLVQPTTFQSIRSSASSANVVTISIVGTTVVPSSATLSYQWQYNTGGGNWTNLANATSGLVVTGNTTTTLTLAPTSNVANNYVYRAVVTATNAGITNSSATANTANAQVLIY
jgi:hypothetical protein